ncbi:MAG: cysteine dioxygenase family protein [Lentimicrobium sp.]|nr:cysteine dioxygenase family protein [Lentimicrobium sp.]
MNSLFSKNLQSLINDLSACKVNHNQQVLDIMQQARFLQEDLEPFFTFNHPDRESYGRKLIFDNGNFKILLMSWKPGDFTAIHNHGYAEWGCVYFFGEAAHRLYTVENSQLTSVEKDTYSEGQLASVCGDLTHLMGNAGTQNIATLHIYGSNSRDSNISENAKIYAPEHQKIFTTMGTAFINMSPELILAEEALPEIEASLYEDYYGLVKLFYKRNRLYSVIENMEKQLDKLASA